MWRILQVMDEVVIAYWSKSELIVAHFPTMVSNLSTLVTG